VGWQVVSTYADLARSAANGKSRPELDRMMGRLSEVDVIAFTKLDRLARSVSHLLKLVDEAQAAGVQLVATDDEIDTTRASGRAMLQMRGVFAELELETTRERYQAMIDHKRQRDEWLGQAPYGWRVKDKHLIRDRQEQTAIRKAARAYVRGGTFAEAAEILGLSSPSPARRILMSHRVQVALGELGDELAVTLRLRRMDRVPASHRSLLGGIARCGECGGPMTLSSTRGGRSGRWMQYRCATKGSGHAGISGPRLEEHVSQAVLDAIDPKQIERRMKKRQKTPKAAEVAAIEARISELEDMLGDGTLTKAAFVRQRDRLNAKITDLRQAEPDDAPELPLDIARNLEAFWPEMTTVERRDVIRAVVRRVVVQKGTAAIERQGTDRGPRADRVALDVQNQLPGSDRVRDHSPKRLVSQVRSVTALGTCLGVGRGVHPRRRPVSASSPERFDLTGKVSLDPDPDETVAVQPDDGERRRVGHPATVALRASDLDARAHLRGLTCRRHSD
jgi:site-specific DNA recombinase